MEGKNLNGSWHKQDKNMLNDDITEQGKAPFLRDCTHITRELHVPYITYAQ